jgi:hypothetical protein
MNVVSVKVVGHRHDATGKQLYTAEWVNKLHNALAKNLSGEHTHFCLTDDPTGLAGWIKPIDIRWQWKTIRRQIHVKSGGWWAKLCLFDPNLPFTKGDRMLFSDLDNLIVGNLDPVLFGHELDKLVLAPHTAPRFRPDATVQLYSSAFMMWTHGYAGQVYTSWTPKVASRLVGDQDWIGTILPNERTFERTFFRRITSMRAFDTAQPPPEVRVIFCTKIKNHIAAEQIPWVKEYWQ